MPAEQKESSVLFSLKELMGLEEDRIRQEEDDKKKRADAELQARSEAEKRARDEEERRLRMEEDRRREEETRKKEDVARIEAIQRGEIERARIEAEQRARMEEMTRQQEHERQLKSLQHDEHKKKLQRTLMISIAAAAILVFGGAGLYFGKIKPEQDQREAAAQAALIAQQEEARKLQAQITEQNKKVENLMGALSQAKTDAEKAAIQAQIAAEQNKAAAISHRPAAGGGGGGGASPKPPAAKPCNCQPGDPLCSCLN